MATTAQIEANRRNAQKSTGPKTERGKARGRRNAITHGMTARTILPVLPQEDAKELEDRTQQAIAAMKPRNPLELDLVCRAVRLSAEIDRAERVGTAHLAHRVRMATRLGTDTVSAEELSRVHDLGSKLFFQRPDTELDVRRFAIASFKLSQENRSLFLRSCFLHNLASVQRLMLAGWFSGCAIRQQIVGGKWPGMRDVCVQCED